jgi:hypothetical protein
MCKVIKYHLRPINRRVAVLHHLNHDITLFIYFDCGEIDLSPRKLCHLILNLVAIRRTLWMIIMSIWADIFSVTWSIKDVKSHFD